jgi:oxygen-dependent protoporphyrinogen oxidase
VIATSASSAAALLKNKSPQLFQVLKQIKMSSIMSVTLFFKNPPRNYQGFGCLIPRGFGIKALGVLMNSYIFADRSKTYNETWMLGGIREDSLLDLSDEQLIQLLKTERERVLGESEAPLSYHINRWKEALPYYDLELEKGINELAQHDSSPIYLHGNYLGGIGLTKILDRSEQLAERIASNHG